MFKQGSWWAAVPHTSIFDLIVSNPPYIASNEIDGLAIEVRVFDPKAALDGGWDGLEAYRAIASQAVRRLNPGGRLMLEIGYNQAEVVSKIMSRAGFGRIETRKDLQGIDRVLVCSHS
jgi:release factor glutamine methyltransferase